MAGKSRLGRGLDSLITPSESGLDPKDIRLVPVELISANPHQPRSHFAEEQLRELADSIETHGVIQPLLLRQGEKEDEFTLIAGERRLEAAKLAGLNEVPAVMREADDQQMVELALIENVQRADLSPLESAQAYQQLHSEFGLSHEQIAKRVGKSRVAITNTLGLLELSVKVKEALSSGEISEGHARALKSLESAQSQNAALDSVVKQGLNVRQTEELVRKLKGGKRTKSKTKPQDPQSKALQAELRDALGTKVNLQHGAKGGRITLFYYSDEELDSLVERLLGK